MTRFGATALAWLALGISGCASIDGGAAASSTSGAANLCVTDDDCVEGECSGGICVAIESALETVAVEVIAPAAVSAGEYQQLRYLSTLSLSSSGAHDFSLSPVANLVVGAKAPSSDCSYTTADDGERLKVSVEALQNPGVSGMASSSYVGASVNEASDNVATLRLPPGEVDLYIVPEVDDSSAESSDDCALVPFLALGQQIGSGSVAFEQRLPAAQRLSVDVSVSVDAEGLSPLEGFVLDLVEPLMGRRLSQQVTLTEGIIEGGIAHHLVELAYQPVVGKNAESLSGGELFRLTPPKTQVSPSFYVARAAVSLFSDGLISIDQVTTVPPKVALSGTVESEVGGEPVISQVTAVLRNTADSTTSAIAQLTVSATTDEDGRFELELVAGDYDVVATPLYETRFASRVGMWTIPPDAEEQTNRDLSLPAVSLLTGKVVGGTEQLGEGTVNVVAVPSTIGESTTFLDNLLGNGRSLGRRSAAVAADADGAFELGVDAGNYDVFVRPDVALGYPWAVRPNTVVAAGPVGLGAMPLSVPLAFSGFVGVPGLSESGASLVLPGALIRVYALLGADGRLVGDFSSASSAVQVAETRANSSGEYELLLPASLN